MTEQQRLEALRLCDQIQATIRKLDHTFAELKEAADDWRAKNVDLLARTSPSEAGQQAKAG